MSDETSTQVKIQMTNKYKTTIVSRRLYKMGSPHEEGDREKIRENTVVVKTTIIFKQ